MKLIKTFTQKWNCEVCGKTNSIKERTAKDFNYCIKHVCECGKIKTLVNDKIAFVNV